SPLLSPLLPPPRRSTLFPSPTLFRSDQRFTTECVHRNYEPGPIALGGGLRGLNTSQRVGWSVQCRSVARISDWVVKTPFLDQGRSEEHTSELQSRENLVCRLLLDKKE